MKTKTPTPAIKKTVRTSGINAAGLKTKKDALLRGERAASRVFKLEKLPDGTIRRVELDPETHRRRVRKTWDAQTEVARARQILNLSQSAFAILLGISLATLRSWEQGKREPSGAARMLIAIAIKHPEIFLEKGLLAS
jgi:putative transcriptional regulator